MNGIYGYIRVSSTDQNEARQWRALEQRGVARERIYADKRSGKDFEREEYRRLLRRLRPGDLVYVASIDRLGRPPKPLPENFAAVCGQWRAGQLTATAAAKCCGMPLTSFLHRAEDGGRGL